jgi:diaminopimelate decarboxylase
LTTETPEIQDGRAFIGGIPASRLAAQYGTPLYVLDAAIVRANIARISTTFPDTRATIYYSVKANPSLGVLGIVRETGARLDVCSPGDVAVAAAAGFAPDQMSYTSCAMTDDEIASVIDSAVPFTADSLSQLERFGRLQPTGTVGLRLNCGIDAGFHPHVRAGGLTSKFGIHLPQLERALEIAERWGLRVVGLHGHLGSGLIDPAPHLALLDALLTVTASVPDVEWLNLGGGFGDLSRYKLELFATDAEARLVAAEQRLRRRLELRLEPGGCIVMNAGCLLASVSEIKESVKLDGYVSPTFVFIDSSHNHLVSAVIYDAEHPIVIADRASEAADGHYDIAGNLLQGGDILARRRALPLPAAGDVLVIGRCGGYAAWRAPNFNERPRPGEVMVDGDRAYVTRHAETHEHMLARENPPRCAELASGKPA